MWGERFDFIPLRVYSSAFFFFLVSMKPENNNKMMEGYTLVGLI